MTNEQLKEALFSGCQVEHNGIIYKCVSGIIYRNKRGKLYFWAEFLYKKNNCFSIVAPEKFKVVVLLHKKKAAAP